MATITPTTTQFVGNNQLGDTGIDGWQVQWAGVGDTSTCAPVQYPGYADKTIQVEGTFGGGHVAINGSNDLVNFEPLNDPTGTAISITAKGIKQILEHTIQYQPALSGSTGANITITMFFRKTQEK